MSSRVHDDALAARTPQPAPDAAATPPATGLLDLPEPLLANILSRLRAGSLRDARAAARALDAASRRDVERSLELPGWGVPEPDQDASWDAPVEPEAAAAARVTSQLSAILLPGGPEGGGGGKAGEGGGPPLAGVTRLCLGSADLDLGALEAVLSAVPNLRALRLSGHELSLPPQPRAGACACGAAAGGDGTVVAAELIAALVPALEALSARDGQLCARGAAALRSLPRLRALSVAGYRGGRAAEGSAELADFFSGAFRLTNDTYGRVPDVAFEDWEADYVCYGNDEYGAAPWLAPDERDRRARQAEAAWRQLPADRLRVLVAGALPAAPGPFDRWSSLVELWAVGLRADQLPSLAAGTPQLRLLSVRPRGPWDAAAVAAACGSAGADTGNAVAGAAAALLRVVRAEFVGCGTGFRGARPGDFLPAVEQLQVGFVSQVLRGRSGFDDYSDSSDDSDEDGTYEGGCGVDLSGLEQLRSLLVAGCGPLGERDYDKIVQMARLVRLACVVRSSDLCWDQAAMTGDPATWPPAPAAAQLARAAPGLECLDLRLAGGADADGVALRSVTRALPRLRSLALGAHLSHDFNGLLIRDPLPFDHPHLTALVLRDWRESAGTRGLLLLPDGKLRALFAPPRLGDRTEFSDLWARRARRLRGLGVFMRPLCKWAEPEYACGWRSYRRWRVADATERLGADDTDQSAPGFDMARLETWQSRW